METFITAIIVAGALVYVITRVSRSAKSAACNCSGCQHAAACKKNTK